MFHLSIKCLKEIQTEDTLLCSYRTKRRVVETKCFERHFRRILLSCTSISIWFKMSACQYNAIMDIYGDHLLQCERGIHGIRRHDAQVRLFEADLIKVAKRPVVEPHLFGRHKERPDISALGSHDSPDMFHIIFFHPLSLAWVRDGMENAMNLLKKG